MLYLIYENKPGTIRQNQASATNAARKRKYRQHHFHKRALVYMRKWLQYGGDCLKSSESGMLYTSVFGIGWKKAI